MNRRAPYTAEEAEDCANVVEMSDGIPDRREIGRIAATLRAYAATVSAGEFFNAVTRKLSGPLSRGGESMSKVAPFTAEEAEEQAREFNSRNFDVAKRMAATLREYAEWQQRQQKGEEWSEEWQRIASEPATDEEIAMHKRHEGCDGSCLPCLDKFRLIVRLEAAEAELARRNVTARVFTHRTVDGGQSYTMTEVEGVPESKAPRCQIRTDDIQCHLPFLHAGPHESTTEDGTVEWGYFNYGVWVGLNSNTPEVRPDSPDACADVNNRGVVCQLPKGHEADTDHAGRERNRLTGASEACTWPTDARVLERVTGIARSVMGCRNCLKLDAVQFCYAHSRDIRDQFASLVLGGE